jgi:hypothetical protein
VIRDSAAPPARLAAAGLTLALSFGLAACSGSSDGAGGTGGTAGTATGSAAPGTATSTAKPPPVATNKPSVAISSAPPVAVGRTSAFKNGVDVLVSRVRTVTVTATGPGDIAGAGVSVSLTVKNSSGKPFDLGGMVVNATYGRNQPASPGGSRNGHPLTGTLTSGATAKGSYVFSVPKGQAGSVKVEVSSDESPLVLVFEN